MREERCTGLGLRLVQALAFACFTTPLCAHFKLLETRGQVQGKRHSMPFCPARSLGDSLKVPDIVASVLSRDCFFLVSF